MFGSGPDYASSLVIDEVVVEHLLNHAGILIDHAWILTTLEHDDVDHKPGHQNDQIRTIRRVQSGSDV